MLLDGVASIILSTTPAVLPSLQTIAGQRGFPVCLFQSTVVSRWLVIPIPLSWCVLKPLAAKSVATSSRQPLTELTYSSAFCSNQLKGVKVEDSSVSTTAQSLLVGGGVLVLTPGLFFLTPYHQLFILSSYPITWLCNCYTTVLSKTNGIVIIITYQTWDSQICQVRHSD